CATLKRSCGSFGAEGVKSNLWTRGGLGRRGDGPLMPRVAPPWSTVTSRPVSMGPTRGPGRVEINRRPFSKVSRQHLLVLSFFAFDSHGHVIGTHSRNGRYGTSAGGPLLRLDVRRPDHLAPLLDLVGNKFSEFGGCQ